MRLLLRLLVYGLLIDRLLISGLLIHGRLCLLIAALLGGRLLIDRLLIHGRLFDRRLVADLFLRCGCLGFGRGGNFDRCAARGAEPGTFG